MTDPLAFWVTNGFPRRLATRFMGWFSRIEQPLVRDLSLAVWRRTADLRLHEAKAVRFRSVHDCFVRELKEGVRPIEGDPAILVSPCDAIVGALGRIEGTRLFQIKGSPYSLRDLVLDPALADRYGEGTYVTLRLKPSMYHRFHAPHDCEVTRVDHIAGDTWNVNPATLKRVPRVFCRNERAVVRARLLRTGQPFALIPVAAVLVAGIRMHCLPTPMSRASRPTVACDARYRKGEEMGWFEHGSTILVLAPGEWRLAESVTLGMTIRMGEALMRIF
jgi:phosphatidylserine decarboxylase